MDNLHKTPEMLALEKQWQEQAARTEDKSSIPGVIGGKDFEIPTLPAATVLMIEMCRDLNVNFQKLSRIIESDPGLSVHLLRVANSAYYAQSKRATSIVRALTVLGLEEVRSIGLSYKLMNAIREFAGADFDFEAYWEKSLLMGVLAKEIARQMRSELLDQAFLVGLLQDIGIVILRTNQEDQYRKIADIQVANPDMALTKLEKQIFGKDHAAVGQEVTRAWKFPELLSRAIGLHHTPLKELYVGDANTEMHAAAYAAGLRPDFLVGTKSMQIVQDLEDRGIVNSESLQEIFSRAHQEFRALAELFRGHLPANSQIAQLMSESVEKLQKMAEAQLAVLEPPE